MAEWIWRRASVQEEIHFEGSNPIRCDDVFQFDSCILKQIRSAESQESRFSWLSLLLEIQYSKIFNSKKCIKINFRHFLLSYKLIFENHKWKEKQNWLDILLKNDWQVRVCSCGSEIPVSNLGIYQQVFKPFPLPSLIDKTKAKIPSYSIVVYQKNS